jgi:hypothetical protein
VNGAALVAVALLSRGDDPIQDAFKVSARPLSLLDMLKLALQGHRNKLRIYVGVKYATVLVVFLRPPDHPIHTAKALECLSDVFLSLSG